MAIRVRMTRIGVSITSTNPSVEKPAIIGVLQAYRAELQATAPVRTGRYRRNFRVTETMRGARLNNRTPYAKYLDHFHRAFRPDALRSLVERIRRAIRNRERNRRLAA